MEKIQPTVEDVAFLITSKIEEAISALEESIFAVCIQPENKNSRMKGNGTAFLAKINNLTCFVTAHHVIENACQEGEIYFLNKNGKMLKFNDIKSGKVFSCKERDFYVFEVTIPDIASIDCPIFSDDIVTDACIVFGFPNSKNKIGISSKNMSGKLHAMKLHLYNTNSQSEKIENDPNSFYFEKWQEKKSLTENLSKCDSIGIVGMSGSPCFHIPIDHDEFLVKNSLASLVKIAGVLIEHKNDHVKFIRMGKLSKLII